MENRWAAQNPKWVCELTLGEWKGQRMNAKTDRSQKKAVSLGSDKAAADPI